MRKLTLLIFTLLCAFAQEAWGQTWTEVGTSSELTDAIVDSAYIRLTEDITISRYLGISGDKTVTIDLNGHVLKRNISSIAGDGNVIRISSGSTLTIQDSSGDNSGQITGGFSSDGGGINNSGTLYFKGGTITGCRVDHEGGAILNNGTVTMSGGVITACRGNDCGGIYNASGHSLTITGGTITGCWSNAGGAAIVNYGTADISGCTFTGNTATTRGGAIWSNGDLIVSNCTFTGNEAQRNDGGAIHLNGGTATLTDVTISNNTSLDAGGIYLTTGATLNLCGTCAITDNHSTEHGGGGITNYGTVVMSGNVGITGNTCHTNGAGIWSNGTLKMEGCLNIILADDADNSELLYQNNGKTAQSVTLTGRTLRKDGSWNTLCLPFGLSAEQISSNAYLADAELMTLDESLYDIETRHLTLNFATATSIEAGKPYLVRWTTGDDIENPVFNSVTIHSSLDNVSTDFVDFIGIYSPEFIHQESVKGRLYLDDSNTLHYPSSEQPQVNSCRGYFAITNIPGDVDGDSNITISDVTALIDIVLENNESNVAADVNRDGIIGISDVTDLIDLILADGTTGSAVAGIETNVGITFGR